MELQKEEIVINDCEEIVINDCEIKSTSEIYLIKQKIQDNYCKIYKCRKTIKNSQDGINNLEKALYKLCQHTFIRDLSATSDDIYKYYCTKCLLYRH